MTKIKIHFIALFIMSGLWLASQNKTEEIKFINPIAIQSINRTDQVVNDFENILTPQQKIGLQQLIDNYKKQTKREISVVTTESFSPYVSIKDFSSDLMNYWGIGKKNQQAALLIVFSKSSKSVYIASNYEGVKLISASDLQTVINSKMLGYFGKKQFYEGLRVGILECMRLWDIRAKGKVKP